MMGINAIFISIAVVLFFTGFLPLFVSLTWATKSDISPGGFLMTAVFVNGFVESRRADVVYFQRWIV
jgi:hypothetical protein